MAHYHIATNKGIDYYNKILVGNSVKSKDFACVVYHALSGRQLRRAANRLNKRSIKKGNGTIPTGFLTKTLDMQ